MSDPADRGVDPDPPALPRLDPDAPARPRLDPDAPPLPRLDPDRAAGQRRPADSPTASPVIDTRPYRWMIGIFGLALVLIVSVIQFATHGVGTTGVPPGQRLRFFSAPLAATNLDGTANPNPPCTLTRHDPRALNVCLLAGRTPLVLALFVTGSAECVRQVDVLQQLAHRFPAAAVAFAAVAINAGHAATAALVRSHRWTIPVAFDSVGRVGSLYGVAICPMLELAYRGGIVKDRLIGEQWQTSGALAPRVSALLANPDGPRP